MDVDPQRSLSLGEFCYAERISKNKYYELKKRGLGPDVTDIDGLQRITPESREAWHERMAERAKSEAARLEAERRHELAVSAGRAAARSPKHVSKQNSKNRRPAAALADSANPATSKRAEQPSRRAPAGAGATT